MTLACVHCHLALICEKKDEETGKRKGDAQKDISLTKAGFPARKASYSTFPICHYSSARCHTQYSGVEALLCLSLPRTRKLPCHWLSISTLSGSHGTSSQIHLLIHPVAQPSPSQKGLPLLVGRLTRALHV